MIILELGSKDLNRINMVDLLVSKYYNTSLYNFWFASSNDMFSILNGLGVIREFIRS